MTRPRDSSRGRTVRGRLTQAGLRVLAVGVPALLLLAAGAGPSAAADSTRCGVAVLAANRTDGQTDLLVSAPAARPPAAGGFHVVQGGRQQAVTVTPVAGRDIAVAVVVASSAQTPPAAFQAARDAALELLRGLPPQARTAVLSSGRAAPLAALSTARATSTQALRMARPGPGDTGPATALRAAAVLPRGGLVVLLSDGTSEGSPGETESLGRTLQERGLVLESVRYSKTAASGPAPVACPMTQDPVLAQVDQAVAVIASQYRVQTVLDPAQPATLTIDQVGSAPVEAAAALGSASPSSPYVAEASSPRADVGYGLAGALGVVGLLLLLLRRQHQDGPAESLIQHRTDGRTPVTSGRS